MRGEQQTGKEPERHFQGSPPHARGAEQGVSRMKKEGGITPACAGSSFSLYFFRVSSWDHPRMRGEQQLGGGSIGKAEGSPPHARGAVFHLFVIVL